MFLSSTTLAFLLPAAGSNASHHILSTKKSHDEEQFIKRVLLENSLFNNIPDASVLVDALERKVAERGDVIINQGDSCVDGYVYLVAEGSCRVLIDNVIVPEPYGILGQNAVFGEQGIL